MAITIFHHLIRFPNHTLRKKAQRKKNAAIAILSFKRPEVQNTTEGMNKKASTAGSDIEGMFRRITITRYHAPENDTAEKYKLMAQ